MWTFKITLRKVVFCVLIREDSTNKRKVEKHVTLHVPVNGKRSKNRRKYVLLCGELRAGLIAQSLSFS